MHGLWADPDKKHLDLEVNKGKLYNNRALASAHSPSL